MKIQVDSKTLAKACSAACKNISSKPVIPIMDNILFQVEQKGGLEGNLRMTTTDNENWTVHNVPVTLSHFDAEDLASFCIEAKAITEFLSAIPSQPVTIEVKRNEYTEFYYAVIAHSAGKAELPVQRAEEFPTLQHINSEGIFLPADTLKRIIQTCRFAVYTDKEAKPQLSAVLLDFKGAQLVGVAADGHKIVRLEIPDVESQPVRFLLHPKCITLLLPMLDAVLADKDSMDDVMLRRDNTKICISSGTDAVYSIMTELRYPNYDSVIPSSKVMDKVAVMDRRDLMAAISRSLLFANAASMIIKFQFDAAGFVKLEGEDVDFSKSSEEKLNCSYTGSDGFRIGLKGTYLKEMLSHFTSDQIRFEMQDASRAIIIREEAGDKNLLMTLMPMFL